MCYCPFIDVSLLFELRLWFNGRADGRSFKPSLLKQSSLLFSPSSTPFRAPVARTIQLIDTHWLGVEEERDGELLTQIRVKARDRGRECLCETPTFGFMHSIVLRSCLKSIKCRKNQARKWSDWFQQIWCHVLECDVICTPLIPQRLQTSLRL